MQIVWNKEAADKLKNSHTVLELESFPVNGEMLTAYCVVPPEKIGIEGFAMLDNWTDLHNEFVKAYRAGNKKLCIDISEHLMGKFGGELDTFYEEILSRLSNT
jgi:hypothetical protein